MIKQKILHFLSPHFLDTEHKKRVLKNISNNIKGDILDIGCGNKPYEHIFTKNKYEGLELKENKNSKADYFYDGNIFPIKDRSYQNIFFFQVLYIIADLDLFLKEVKRVNKNNGCILLSDSFMNSDNFNTHKNRFTETGIKKIIETKGYNIIDFYKILPGFLSILNIINLYLTRDILWKIDNKIIKILLYLPIYIIISINNLIGYCFLNTKKSKSEFYEGFIILAQKNENNFNEN